MTGTPLDHRQLGAWTDTVGPGWAALLHALHERLFALAPDYRIETCERSLGGLRVCVADRFDAQGYFDGHWADAATLLTDATEQAAGRTCEMCGAEGRPRFRGGPRGSWITALCDTCAADHHRTPIRPRGTPSPR
ncbi:hypothetical protein [Streptomyces radicis]|uniref:TraR/DksA family transcriptional regulator n=1 Tax=Streptomyces radicis TaxID=1750517 RepID=A0A3A9WHD2_9ACTN|nr:hypothetical protein [Streptomyces radicis]RKN12189.1 hypothetical protein D7319_04765 [Streptomyces radicis]RKN25759.1 hypothetical protein D7318_05715 [Streptomyces radicis]